MYLSMKRIVSLIAILAVCVSFCACGTSKEAQKADELILSIGEVTLDSEPSILAAKIYYDTLTDKQKSQVENYSILESAIIVVDSLKKEEELRKIEEEYAQIYESAKDFEAKNLIDEACAEYDKLPSDYKDVAQRKEVLTPLVGVAGTWICDNLLSTSNRGTQLRAIYESINLKVEITDSGNPSISFDSKMTYVGPTNDIVNGDKMMLYALGNGYLYGKREYRSDGSYILGESGIYTTGYGGLDFYFSITKDGKLEIKYDGDNYGKQTIVTYTYSKS